jgi:hypothetical protein
MALAFVVLTSAPGTALAAPKDEPKSLTQSLTGPAREDFDAARTLFSHDDFANAAIKFRSAYDRSHDARLLWNVASCEQKLKHYARTRSLLERYLEEGGTALTNQDRRDAENVLKTIAPFVSTVTVTTRPDETEVVVDGESVGKTPLTTPLYVELGKHEVIVRKDGFRQVSRPIVATGGDSLVVSVQLEAQPHEGLLEVRADASDMIALDGENLGIGSVSKTVASGHHTLRVTSRGREPRQMEIVIDDDKSKSVDMRAPPSKTSTTTWLLVGGGAAILTAGAVIGGYFLFRPASGTGTPQTPGTLGAVDLR